MIWSNEYFDLSDTSAQTSQPENPLTSSTRYTRPDRVKNLRLKTSPFGIRPSKQRHMVLRQTSNKWIPQKCTHEIAHMYIYAQGGGLSEAKCFIDY